VKLRLVWVLSLVLLPSYSYSEPYTYGTTDNAVSNALRWTMDSILPSIGGVDINGLLYRYTTVKDPDADMKVHVSNRNANGDGYTFRETDDWSGVPGNTIVKSFPLSNIPASNWGTGSIEVEGEGTVKDAVVIYSYRLDRCYDPQADPTCAGYVKPIPKIPEPIEYPKMQKVVIYNSLEDDAVKDNLESDDFEYEDEDDKRKESEEEDTESRIEMGLMASENALTLFKTQSQNAMIVAINKQTNINMYYNTQINGGTLNDAAGLKDGTISDNKKALRNNLAQQLLHEKMIDLQYNK